MTTTDLCVHDGKVYLADLDLARIAPLPNSSAQQWAEFIHDQAFATTDYFKSRFMIVDDETMTFLWETQTQLDALGTYGCDLIQGFLLARPLGSAATIELLQANASARHVSRS